MVVTNTPAAWDKRAETHTAAHEAAMWSRDGQRARFERALEWAQPREGESVLDFGCGVGALAGWVPQCQYTGVDWSDRMLARAEQDYPRGEYYGSLDELPRSAWSEATGDVNWSRYDCVFAIGPFNLRDNWSAEQTHETVSRLWVLTYRVLVVSVLRNGPDDHITYDADSLALFADARAPMWALDASYLPNDMMLVMRR